MLVSFYIVWTHSKLFWSKIHIVNALGGKKKSILGNVSNSAHFLKYIKKK